MLKRLLVLLAIGACSLSSLQVQAQFKVLGESERFEEPQSGHVKILKDDKGNTFFYTLTQKVILI